MVAVYTRCHLIVVIFVLLMIYYNIWYRRMQLCVIPIQLMTFEGFRDANVYYYTDTYFNIIYYNIYYVSRVYVHRKTLININFSLYELYPRIHINIYRTFRLVHVLRPSDRPINLNHIEVACTYNLYIVIYSAVGAFTGYNNILCRSAQSQYRDVVYNGCIYILYIYIYNIMYLHTCIRI